MREELLGRRAPEIRGMFGRIAPRYDLLNRILSLGLDLIWRRRLAGRVERAGDGLAVDVCTGTGDVALALPERLAVMGSDFCTPMLARARRKASRRGRSLPLFAADAASLPLADGRADVVTVAFGVRNFEDLEHGLSELARVLRAGGLLLILEFSQPRGLLAPLLGWWARTVPPLVGGWVSGDAEAYSYLPASVATFPDREGMCSALQRVGLVRVSATPLTGGIATLYEGSRADG